MAKDPSKPQNPIENNPALAAAAAQIGAELAAFVQGQPQAPGQQPAPQAERVLAEKPPLVRQNARR